MGSSPLPESSATPGTLVGEKYRLVRLVGRGAFGSVFEAEHVALGRRVAIKVLHGGWDFPRSHQRFAREARALARLDHENIVSLIDAGEDAAVGQYLVLEFIRGQQLRAVLPAMQGRAAGEIVAVVQQLARGLGHAHAAGIVHRDLKPENVMLSSHADGELLVKILDFGIARLFDADEELITMTGAALGTAAYMAPEQARGDRDVDHRVDVYAMGVIVYEALAGVRPFDGGSYNQTLFQILTKAHAPLAMLRPDLSSELCDAVERAMAKERTARFDGVEDFARALGAAQRTTGRGRHLESGATLEVAPELARPSHDRVRGDTTSISATSISATRAPASEREPAGAGVRQIAPNAAIAGVVAGAAIGFVLSMAVQQSRAVTPIQPPAYSAFERQSGPLSTLSNAVPRAFEAVPSAPAPAPASAPALRLEVAPSASAPSLAAPHAPAPRRPPVARPAASSGRRVDRGF